MRQIESYYLHLSSAGAETKEFNQAILSNPKYLKVPNYYYWLERYDFFYRRNQLKLVFFEDFVSNPLKEIESLLNYLELDVSKFKLPQKIEKNQSSDKYIDRKLVQSFRGKFPGMTKFEKKIDGKMRLMIKKILRKKVCKESHIMWEDDAKNHVLSQLSPFTEKFLKKAGKPNKFWPMA